MLRLGIRRLSSAASSIAPEGGTKGRFQHWKKPVYYAPVVNPLEEKPDFSFTDGRRVSVTSKAQLDYKLDQLRLSKRIVEVLKEVEQMEERHRIAEEERRLEEQKRQSLRPKPKGNHLIA